MIKDKVSPMRYSSHQGITRRSKVIILSPLFSFSRVASFFLHQQFTFKLTQTCVNDKLFHDLSGRFSGPATLDLTIDQTGLKTSCQCQFKYNVQHFSALSNLENHLFYYTNNLLVTKISDFVKNMERKANK